MWPDINPRSSVPMFQQVVDGLKEKVAKGLLSPGDRISSVRELAMELTLNHNTIVRAYQELERENVIEVIDRRGTFIALQPSVPRADERKAELREAMRKMLVEAHHLQLTVEDLMQMFREVAHEWMEGLEGSADGVRDSDESTREDV